MPNKNADYFKERAKTIFSFLRESYSFKRQSEFRDDRIGVVGVLFRGEHCGIELSWDSRDQFVECEIGSLISGEWPTSMVIRGRRFKESLFQYAVNNGFRGALTNNRNRHDVKRFIDDNLYGYARILKNYGQKILKDSNNLFE